MRHLACTGQHTLVNNTFNSTDSKLSQTAPSILAMTSMAVAIDGLSMTEKTCWRLRDIVTQIHESTHRVNEVSFATSTLTFMAFFLYDLGKPASIREKVFFQIKSLSKFKYSLVY